MRKPQEWFQDVRALLTEQVFAHSLKIDRRVDCRDTRERQTRVHHLFPLRHHYGF